MLGRCGGGSGEYAAESEEKAGEFSVYRRCGVLRGSEEVPKEFGIAIFALRPWELLGETNKVDEPPYDLASQIKI